MKIYGTIGPACANADTLRKMITCGMTGVRINMSHGTLKSFSGYLDELRKAEDICGKKLELVIDMEGPELRIGKLTEPIVLTEGQDVILGVDIPIDEQVISQLENGMICHIDDGKIELSAVSKHHGGFLCKVLHGGVLTSKKSFAVKDHTFQTELLTKRDIENLKDASKAGVSGILQPFVRSADDVINVKRILSDLGCGHIKVLSKIEDSTGISNAEEIIKASDTVVFARGDLGNTMDMWLLPPLQKKVAKLCKKYGKPLVIATQLLASMENNPTPTRAEMNDIYNSAADGAEGLMLTGETAAGKYPDSAIFYLTQAAMQAQIT